MQVTKTATVNKEHDAAWYFYLVISLCVLRVHCDLHFNFSMDHEIASLCRATIWKRQIYFLLEQPPTEYFTALFHFREHN